MSYEVRVDLDGDPSSKNKSVPFFLAQYMHERGATSEQISQATNDLAAGVGYDDPDPARGFLEAWAGFVVGELAVPAGAAALPGAVAGIAAKIFARSGRNLGQEVGETAAVNMVNGLRLKTQLAFEEAGILTRGGYGLTDDAIGKSIEIPVSGGVLKNPAVVRELTADGSKIEEWSKYTTESITLPSGQRSQVHFYKNNVNGKVNLNVDFKVKGEVK